MLTIAKLTDDEIESLQARARRSLKCRHAGFDQSFACRACRLRGHGASASHGAHAEEWLLTYVAAERAIPHAWAGAAFRTLGEESDYAARLRGFLMIVGCDALTFEPEAEPPTYRVRLDVSAIAGAAWDAWCDGPTDTLVADGIDVGGLSADYFEI